MYTIKNILILQNKTGAVAEIKTLFILWGKDLYLILTVKYFI